MYLSKTFYPRKSESMDQNEDSSASKENSIKTQIKNTNPNLINFKLINKWRDIVRQVNSFIVSYVPKKVIVNENNSIFNFFHWWLPKIQKFFVRSKFDFYGLQLISEKPSKNLLKVSLEIPILMILKRNLYRWVTQSILIVSLKTKLLLRIFFINSFLFSNLAITFNIKNFPWIISNCRNL